MSDCGDLLHRLIGRPALPLAQAAARPLPVLSQGDRQFRTLGRLRDPRRVSPLNRMRASADAYLRPDEKGYGPSREFSVPVEAHLFAPEQVPVKPHLYLWRKLFLTVFRSRSELPEESIRQMAYRAFEAVRELAAKGRPF